ncbi:MAG: sulfatase-like hydrolase/transferase [Dehalococcoidia bacterium]
MSQPNVLFIMADQMKATASTLYSEIGAETPSLARLSREGVRFQNAVTPHPLCVPARTSVMTSRYPHSTGCRRNETLMPAGEPHAFSIWKEAGFVTGLIGKNHCYDRQEDLCLFDVRCEIGHRGLSAGGETHGMEWVRPIDAINAAHATRRDMPWQSPRVSYAVTDYPVEDYSTALVTAQTERFLEDHTDQPFALWVSYPDPHEPYEVPRQYADMFPPEKGKLPPYREQEFADGSAPERNRVLHRILGMENAEDDVRRMIGVYLAMVRFVDDGVGRILDVLERLGLRDNTIVVFTSDHGDFMGEHHMAVKGGVFYDCLTRVPLIVSWPGRVPQGEVDDSMVNTVDILPTLLRPQGLDVPRRMQGAPLPTVTDAEPREAAFSEYGAGGPPFTMADLEMLPEPHGYQTLIDTLWAREAEGRRKMVRTRRWKYVHDPMGDLDELYDLSADPWELTNVAGDPGNGNVVSEMRKLLAGWMIQTEDPEPVQLPETTGRPPDNHGPG